MKTIAILIFLVLVLTHSAYTQVRVKDVTRVEGVQEKRLIGYGLVVGLDGTGDGSRTMFTVHSIVNMLRNLGIYIPNTRLRVRNVAAVIVTTTLAPFSKEGAKLDVTVSSIGDAVSLEGGMLLLSPLQDDQGETYAVAQGPVSVGGYSVSKVKNHMRKKNHTLSGEISDGAIVKREILDQQLNNRAVRFSLRQPDFTSAVEMTKAINKALNNKLAVTLDAATVNIEVPEEFRDDLIPFIAQIEQVQFTPNRSAKVVINEKTGTIVAGGNVTMSEVAVSHGSITVSVTQTLQVSQPLPQTLGRTQVTQTPQVQVQEEVPEMVVLNQTANVGDLATALNNIGVTPRDMIAIFQAIKKAGALNAELVVM